LFIIHDEVLLPSQNVSKKTSSGSGNVVDEKFDPLIRQVAITLANKVSYLPKFMISRLSDDELYELLGKMLANLAEGEADRILEAELHTMFAPLGTVLSFLFPRTPKDNQITHPQPQLELEPVDLKNFIIFSLYFYSFFFIPFYFMLLLIPSLICFFLINLGIIYLASFGLICYGFKVCNVLTYIHISIQIPLNANNLLTLPCFVLFCS